MIADDQFAEIRRLFFAEHLRIGEIASQLGVHHTAVRRAIGADAFNQRKAAPSRPSALDPYWAFVVETLERYPRIRSTRLFLMAKERGYSGSVVQLRRYVATVRTAPTAEAFLRRSTLPGEEAQVDWAHFGTMQVGHARRALMCFVIVLAYCRAIFAWFFHDQTTASFLSGHVRAFNAFGGVPRRILHDNLKSAVVERVGDAIRFGEDLLNLAAHYHFEPRACAPYRGNEKGKVERAIRYLRESFFTGRHFTDIDDLNRQLGGWITDVAHRRVVPGDAQGRTVAVLLDAERPRLLPLPASAFPTDRVEQLCSGKTPYLRFDRNDYSIPYPLVGRPLILRASDESVRILDGAGQVVASHRRSFEAGATVEDPEHLRALRQHKRHARELRGRPELCRLCPSAERLLQALLERGSPFAAEVRALLLLCDRWGAGAVDSAIVHCLDRGECSAHAVERRLDEEHRRLGGAPRLDTPVAPPARRLPATDLGAYDDLSVRKERKP